MSSHFVPGLWRIKLMPVPLAQSLARLKRAWYRCAGNGAQLALAFIYEAWAL
jgi:hypothetical protein